VKQESVKHLADGATTLAVSAGASSYFDWFTFINSNAPGIGVLLSLIFGLIGLIFYYLNWKKSTLADDNKNRLDDYTEKTDSRFKKLDDGIVLILSKLNKLDKAPFFMNNRCLHINTP